MSAATFGAYANSGQICMSTECIVVDAKVADDFVAKLAARATGLPLGDPRLGPVVLGSVVDMSTVERCNALIDNALAKGATLMAGGKAANTLMPATVLDHVTTDMNIFREEAFGPVKGVVRVNGVEAAGPTVHDDAQMLFGGVKGSGIGRFGGKAGIEAFTDLRWITVQTAPRHYPF